jgi:hypothetical protein
VLDGAAAPAAATVQMAAAAAAVVSGRWSVGSLPAVDPDSAVKAAGGQPVGGGMVRQVPHVAPRVGLHHRNGLGTAHMEDVHLCSMPEA